MHPLVTTLLENETHQHEIHVSIVLYLREQGEGFGGAADFESRVSIVCLAHAVEAQLEIHYILFEVKVCLRLLGN